MVSNITWEILPILPILQSNIASSVLSVFYGKAVDVKVYPGLMYKLGKKLVLHLN